MNKNTQRSTVTDGYTLTTGNIQYYNHIPQTIEPVVSSFQNLFCVEWVFC